MRSASSFSDRSPFFYGWGSAKPFTINYRVENIAVLVAELKKDNVIIIDEIAEL
ncbi:hypothetical protein H7F33_07810 [Pedobacter sp. PAMC26386]|nr:hypothetical protein H7F33_07810 [Pedobacter sp. PAMC26386]